MWRKALALFRPTVCSSLPRKWRYPEPPLPRGHGSNQTRPRPAGRPGTPGLSKAGLAADRRNRDMAHRRIGFGAMPMALAGLDVHDIADIDLALVMLGCDHSRARGHDQDLVAGMGMPTGGATLAEVHHAAIIVRRVPRLDNGLTRPGNRSGPPFDRRCAFHRDVRDVFKCDHLHDDPPHADGRSRYTKSARASDSIARVVAG